MAKSKRCEGVDSKKSRSTHNATGACGRMQKRAGRKRRCPAPAGGKFCQVVYRNVETTNEFTALPSQEMSNRSLFSYAIVNRGSKGAVVQLEIGPNDSDYLVDMESEINGGSMDIIVPSKFMRFVRVSVRSLDPGLPTKLTVYYQAQ